MPEAGSRTKPSARPVAREKESARAEALPPLLIRYYRRMKLQKVYPFVIAWQKGKGKLPAGKEVTLRLLLAGAQVVPAEQVLATDADAKVTFHVTPLATGWLRGQRLEVLHQGRKIQELPLASRVVTQKVTLILLLLTFLVPWFFLTYFKYSPLTYQNFVNQPGLGKTVLTTLPPDKTLEKGLKENLPSVPDSVRKDYPEVYDALLEARKTVADVYGKLCSAEQPIAFYFAATFLTLTLFSAWVHSAKSKKYRGKPITLPRDEGPSGASRRTEELFDT